MRLCYPIIFFISLSISSFSQTRKPVRQRGQTKPVVYSASSDWQKVTLKLSDQPNFIGPPEIAQPEPGSKPVSRSGADAPSVRASRNTPSARNSAGYRPAFTGDFATNRNGWKAGNKGDYNYQIGLGKYDIRRRSANTTQIAFSYVPLPTEINLNIAKTFTIKVDVVADSGQVPTGGILFGVADSLNYCAFSLNGTGDISVVRVANGQTFGDYMPGDYFKPGVPLEKNRDRLSIRRNGDALHFYINDREVRSSPYPFRMFSGNSIGLTTTGYWTSFQKLTVTLGP